jgi:hypothetical protein
MAFLLGEVGLPGRALDELREYLEVALSPHMFLEEGGHILLWSKFEVGIFLLGQRLLLITLGLYLYS